MNRLRVEASEQCGGQWMYDKILVPVDGSVASERGLREAAKVALACQASVRLIHAVNEYFLDNAYAPTPYYAEVTESLRSAGRQLLDSAAAFLRGQGVTPSTVLREALGGGAAALILEESKAWGADLIVMGTHGRRGVRRLLMGSDAEQVLRSSTVPVLLVRGDNEAAGETSQEVK